MSQTLEKIQSDYFAQTPWINVANFLRSFFVLDSEESKDLLNQNTLAPLSKNMKEELKFFCEDYDLRFPVVQAYFEGKTKIGLLANEKTGSKGYDALFAALHDRQSQKCEYVLKASQMKGMMASIVPEEAEMRQICSTPIGWKAPNP